MPLALFDLDNTLLAGDSDHLWGCFLVEQKVVDKDYYAKENDRFYREYEEGVLDIEEWLAFQLQPLTVNSNEDINNWRRKFLDEYIKPIVLDKGLELIDKHRQQQDTIVIVTATNSFITEPIAQLLGVEHLIATELEIVDGRYTGTISGTPSYQSGKVIRLSEWLEKQEKSYQLSESWFYSDSHNDIPLLSQVGKPVAVDPDDRLKQHAQQNNWEVISLR